MLWHVKTIWAKICNILIYYQMGHFSSDTTLLVLWKQNEARRLIWNYRALKKRKRIFKVNVFNSSLFINIKL